MSRGEHRPKTDHCITVRRNTHVSEFVRGVIPNLSRYGSNAFVNMGLRGMPFDFGHAGASASSDADCVPNLFPHVAIV